VQLKWRFEKSSKYFNFCKILNLQSGFGSTIEVTKNMRKSLETITNQLKKDLGKETIRFLGKLLFLLIISSIRQVGQKYKKI